MGFSQLQQEDLKPESQSKPRGPAWCPGEQGGLIWLSRRRWPWQGSKPGRRLRLPDPPCERRWCCYKVWATLLSQGAAGLAARSTTGPWADAGCSLSSRGELQAASRGKLRLTSAIPLLSTSALKELNHYLPFVPVFSPRRPPSAALYEGWPGRLLALAEPCLSLVQFQHWP